MPSSNIGGVDALLRQLNQFGNQVEAVAAKEAQATAEAIRDTAKELAPVVSGRLRDSIRAVQDAGGFYRVGTDVPYALAKELGVRNSVARPFLYPAYLLHKDKFLNNLKQAINRL